MSGNNIPNLIAQNICWDTLFAGLLPKYKRFAVLWRHSSGRRLRSVCGRVCLMVCFSFVFWFVLFICLWPANLLICLRSEYLIVDFALNYRLSSIYNCSGGCVRGTSWILAAVSYAIYLSIGRSGKWKFIYFLPKSSLAAKCCNALDNVADDTRRRQRQKKDKLQYACKPLWIIVAGIEYHALTHIYTYTLL